MISCSEKIVWRLESWNNKTQYFLSSLCNVKNGHIDVLLEKKDIMSSIMDPCLLYDLDDSWPSRRPLISLLSSSLNLQSRIKIMPQGFNTRTVKYSLRFIKVTTEPCCSIPSYYGIYNLHWLVLTSAIECLETRRVWKSAFFKYDATHLNLIFRCVSISLKVCMK